MAKRFKKNRAKNSGIAVIFSILIIGVLLSIVLVLTNIFIIQLKLSGETKYSAAAFYAAESGIEYCLYLRKVIDVTPTPAPPDMENDAVFETNNCDSGDIKSIGTYKGVTRAIEVSF